MIDLNEHMIRKIWNVNTDTGEWPKYLDAVNKILIEYEDDKAMEIKYLLGILSLLSSVLPSRLRRVGRNSYPNSKPKQRDMARIGRVNIISKLTKKKKELQKFIQTEADWLEEQGFGTDAERFRAAIKGEK